MSTDEPFAARAGGWVLTVAGAIGFVASFVLIVEKIALIRNPAYVPTCSINPLLSCGSVMSTPQAELFGFPNPLLGVAAFPIVTLVGALTVAGVRLPRWVWLGFQAGTLLGLVFVHWLMFQSLYRIGALCPYCMVVWVVTIAVCWYALLRNLWHEVIVVPWPRAAGVALSYHGLVVTVWLLAIGVLIGVRFWDYWRTLM